MGRGRRRLLTTWLTLMPGPALAAPQAATGSVEAAVHACSGSAGRGPLAGAAVSLTCPGVERHAVTGPDGRVWFGHLRPQVCRLEVGPPGSRPGLEVEILPGFRHSAGPLAFGDCAPEVAVVPVSPSHQDNVTLASAEDLRRAPRPTDVWSILRDVPGVLLDRVDVGGSETAQQSLVLSHADPGTGASWTLDGIDITDAAALGSASLYPDVDALEYVQARTGPSDVRVRTAGLQVGLYLREPANRRSGGVLVRGSADPLQADNLPADLRSRPFFRNRSDRLLELGGELGGPAIKDRGWLWGAASKHSLRQDTFTEHQESLSTTSFIGKGRLRVRGGSLSLLALRAEKRHQDRDTTLTAAPEARWRQSGPVHLVAAEDQRTWRDVSILTRVSYLDAGFRLEPQGGAEASPFEDFQGVWQGGYYTFDTDRPRLQVGLEAAARRRALGRDHELIAGVGYRGSRVTTRLRWPGNQVLALERQSVFFRTFRLTGFALPTRELEARSVHHQVEAYLQDSVRLGPFIATAGVRFDRLAGHNLASSVSANPVFPDLLPAVTYGGAPGRIRWLDVLPRAALAWEDRGSGRLSVRAGYAAYGGALGAGEVTFDNPVGRDYASLTYYWLDRNGDHAVQSDELDLLRGMLAGSVDPRNPSSAVSPHLIEPGLRSPRTHQGTLAVEQKISRAFAAGAHLAVRRTVDGLWRPLRNLALTDYVIRGAVRGQLFGEPYAVGYYGPASESKIVPGNGRVLANRVDYRQDSLHVDLTLRGQIDRVHFEVWLGVDDARERFESEAAIQDPTSLDVEPLQDNGRIAVRPGGLGRGDLFVNARWTAGGLVTAELPWDLRVAAHVYARDGFPIPYVQVGASGDSTTGAKNVLISPHLDSYRLPPLLLMDLRLARTFKLRGGRLTADVDVFNLLNRATTLQVARDVELPSFGRPREILRPRIVRLGLRYDF